MWLASSVSFVRHRSRGDSFDRASGRQARSKARVLAETEQLGPLVDFLVEMEVHSVETEASCGSSLEQL